MYGEAGIEEFLPAFDAGPAIAGSRNESLAGYFDTDHAAARIRGPFPVRAATSRGASAYTIKIYAMIINERLHRK